MCVCSPLVVHRRPLSSLLQRPDLSSSVSSLTASYPTPAQLGHKIADPFSHLDTVQLPVLTLISLHYDGQMIYLHVPMRWWWCLAYWRLAEWMNEQIIWYLHRCCYQVQLWLSTSVYKAARVLRPSSTLRMDLVSERTPWTNVFIFSLFCFRVLRDGSGLEYFQTSSHFISRFHVWEFPPEDCPPLHWSVVCGTWIEPTTFWST